MHSCGRTAAKSQIEATASAPAHPHGWSQAVSSTEKAILVVQHMPYGPQNQRCDCKGWIRDSRRRKNTAAEDQQVGVLMGKAIRIDNRSAIVGAHHGSAYEVPRSEVGECRF